MQHIKAVLKAAQNTGRFGVLTTDQQHTEVRKPCVICIVHNLATNTLRELNGRATLAKPRPSYQQVSSVVERWYIGISAKAAYPTATQGGLAGMVRHVVVCYGVGALGCGEVRWGAVGCGGVRWGAVQCGVVRCGVV